MVLSRSLWSTKSGQEISVVGSTASVSFLACHLELFLAVTRCSRVIKLVPSPITLAYSVPCYLTQGRRALKNYSSIVFDPKPSLKTEQSKLNLVPPLHVPFLVMIHSFLKVLLHMKKCTCLNYQIWQHALCKLVPFLTKTATNLEPSFNFCKRILPCTFFMVLFFWLINSVSLLLKPFTWPNNTYVET